MSGSGTIRVIKRDRSVEVFDVRKLAGAIWRASIGGEAMYSHAVQISEALEVYLLRKRETCLTSSAIFEMAIKALHCVGLSDAARRSEAFRSLRGELRNRVRIVHEGGRQTRWDKGWLVKLAANCWLVSPETARIVAGRVERRIFSRNIDRLGREEVIAMLNEVMAEYGLADAVPAI